MAQQSLQLKRNQLCDYFGRITKSLPRLRALLAIGPLLQPHNRSDAFRSMGPSDNFLTTHQGRFKMTATETQINALLRECDAGDQGAQERLNKLLEAGFNDFDLLGSVIEIVKMLVLNLAAGESEALRRIAEERIRDADSLIVDSAADGVLDGNQQSSNPVERLLWHTVVLANLIVCVDLVEQSRAHDRRKDAGFWLRMAGKQMTSIKPLIQALLAYRDRPNVRVVRES
jgi:hypothetical protein